MKLEARAVTEVLTVGWAALAVQEDWVAAREVQEPIESAANR